MTPEQVVAKAFGIHQSQVSDATSNMNLEAWDSLGHMNLVLALEAAYGLSLSPGEALRMTDVATIKHILRERGVTW